MNKQILFLTVGVATGGAAVYLLSRPTATDATIANDSKIVVESTAPKAVAAKNSEPAITTKSSTEVATPPKSSAWSKLAERFGVEKTTKSNKITKDLADLMDDGMQMAETMAKNNGAGSMAELAGREAVKNLTEQLGLTEEQQAKAKELIQSSVDDRMKMVGELSGAMRSDPESMMELFLAGDARSRGEMTQEEYDTMTGPTRTMLENFSTLVMGNPGGGGNQIFGDEAFTSKLNQVLTPEQQTKLSGLVTEMAQQQGGNTGRRNPGQMLFRDGALPVMELEKMDQTMTSVKQMASAAKVMMEAMKGLQDATAKPPGQTPATGTP
jgi:hypothetical protein